MEYDKDKIDEYTLALLCLVMHDEDEYRARAWKGREPKKQKSCLRNIL
jgi:hypothetical protein